MDYEYSTASTYQEAFRDLHDDGAEVLMVEWDLPDKEVYDICQTIQELYEALGFIYIIVMAQQHEITNRQIKRKILKSFEYGVDNVVVKPVNKHEVQARLESAKRIIQLHRDLQKQNLALHKTSAELALSNMKNEQLAITDELTKTYNRRYMINRFRELLEVAVRNNQPLSCLMLDVDNFKGYNDSYGHDVGDQVLKYLARLIQKNSRTGNIIARFGGEEFVVICPNTTLDQATEYAERLRKSISDKPLLLDEELLLYITVSIGLSTKDNLTTEYSEMIRIADQNLYKAKEQGKNRVVSKIAG
jgi:diguanylate cyclase (GGDEF)-like protein